MTTPHQSKLLPRLPHSSVQAAGCLGPCERWPLSLPQGCLGNHHSCGTDVDHVVAVRRKWVSFIQRKWTKEKVSFKLGKQTKQNPSIKSVCITFRLPLNHCEFKHACIQISSHSTHSNASLLLMLWNNAVAHSKESALLDQQDSENVKVKPQDALQIVILLCI